MQPKNTLLTVAEILVMGGILFALISPLFSPSPESEQSIRRSTSLPIQLN